MLGGWLGDPPLQLLTSVGAAAKGPSTCCQGGAVEAAAQAVGADLCTGHT
jgi:hypothetical protein